MPQCSSLPGVDKFQEIYLTSVTVFWYDLGLPKHITADMTPKLADKWDDEIGPWLVDNSRDVYQPHADGVWFRDPKDAMLFKLTWSGQMI